MQAHDRLQSRGNSVSWNNQKSAVLRLYTLFRTSSAQRSEDYDEEFDNIPEETLCSKTFFTDFAEYKVQSASLRFFLFTKQPVEQPKWRRSNFEGSEWDPYFTAVFSEVGQTKNAKIKIACFVAGKDQYCCFFTCLGDLFALDEEFARNADDATLWIDYELSIILLQPADFGENPIKTKFNICC